MISLDVADRAVIAGQTLATGADAALCQLDLTAARAALTEADSPGRGDRRSVHGRAGRHQAHVQEPFDWSSVALRRPVMVPGSLSTLTSIGSPAKAAHVAPADSCGCGPDGTWERSALLRA
jgi:hypothetical protein